MTTTRRERLRAETIQEIKDAAYRQIAEVGASNLSLRGIARAIRMSPAGLYRYYDGLDAIITELITDSYDDLASATGAAMVSDTPRARMIEGTMGYRRWCVEHPERFMLIFGTPIPGYAAPEDGPTVDAVKRIGAQFFSVVGEAVATGAMSLPEPRRAPTQAEMDAVADFPGEVPAQLLPLMFAAWGHFHGLVTLELLGHFDWAVTDFDDFYRVEMERLADWLGL